VWLSEFRINKIKYFQELSRMRRNLHSAAKITAEFHRFLSFTDISSVFINAIYRAAVIQISPSTFFYKSGKVMPLVFCA